MCRSSANAPRSTPTSVLPATTMAALPLTVVAWTTYPSAPALVSVAPSDSDWTIVDEAGVPSTTAPATLG